MKIRIIIFALFAFTAIKAQTPEEKKYLDASQKELNEIRLLTIKGLKECRRWELFHLKFRQVKRTNKDIKTCKKDF